MDFPAELQRVLESMVRLMVDRQSDVHVLPVPGSGVNLQVQVHASELGKLIGKQGRTARSLRTLLSAMGQAAQTTVHVDFVESSALNSVPSRAAR